ncbi:MULTISPECIES: winged helix-turn-helix domain-containing protein [unclassified Streptomyces]|uniref:winged helix-turn-helix domain-containing protein n=1 Tax=unclassified Streptomyces TaxID=2593676 RepID=UPI0004BDFA13|nr:MULTISPECIES: winged helix-turn-helix domain-containing protein [unclassified Streptomyces]
MTTAVPVPVPVPSLRRSPAPRLQLVGDRTPFVSVDGADGGRVGYLVFLPANVDPVALMSAHGIRPETQPLEPGTPVESDHSDDAIRVDRARRLVEVDGRALDLTYLEFDLLAHLVAHPYTVHTRDALISGVWGYGHIGDGRTVDVHVARLRRKVGPAYRDRISTVRRVGYRYVPDRR